MRAILVGIAGKKGVQMVVAVLGFGAGHLAPAALGQCVGPGLDAAGERAVQVGQDLGAAVVQDAVNAKVEFGQVEFEDALLEQV